MWVDRGTVGGRWRGFGGVARHPSALTSAGRSPPAPRAGAWPRTSATRHPHRQQRDVSATSREGGNGRSLLPIDHMRKEKDHPVGLTRSSLMNCASRRKQSSMAATTGHMPQPPAPPGTTPLDHHNTTPRDPGVSPPGDAPCIAACHDTHASPSGTQPSNGRIASPSHRTHRKARLELGPDGDGALPHGLEGPQMDVLLIEEDDPRFARQRAPAPAPHERTPHHGAARR
jgi:hypothetical protein